MKRLTFLLCLSFVVAACSSSTNPSNPNTFTATYQPLNNSSYQINWTATKITASSTNLSANDAVRSIVFAFAKPVGIGSYVDTGAVPPVTCTFTDSTGTYVHKSTGSEQYYTGCNVVVKNASGNSYSGTFTFVAHNMPLGGQSTGWSGAFSVSY